MPWGCVNMMTALIALLKRSFQLSPRGKFSITDFCSTASRRSTKLFS